MDGNPSAAVGVRVSVARAVDEVSVPAMRETPCHNFGLTRRELDVVTKVVTGSMNKSIAFDLAISAGTVKRHIANIYAKLGVSNRLELVLFTAYHQVIDLPGFHGE